MSNSPIRVAVVGCGGIGGRHCEAYRRIPGVVFGAFVDSDIERARKFSEKYGAGAAYASLSEAPAGSIDLVSVTTPPMLHTAAVLEALEAGVHVFCEKPITMDMGEALQVYEKSRQKGIPVGVGFKMRFEPVFQKARELIGEIGELLAVSTVKIQPYHRREGFDWVPAVGAMYELSVHEYDLIGYITGRRPRRVYGRLAYAPGWTREKRAFLQVAYEGGVTGQLMSLYSEDASFLYRDLTMTFVGTRGYLRVERPDRIVVHTSDFRVLNVEAGDGLAPFVEELSAYMGAMDGGKLFPCAGLADAWTATALVEAANESAKSDRWIPVPAVGEADK